MGNTGMRLLPTIAVTALVLAGCAGNPDKLADANVCEPSTPASQGATNQLFPSSGLNVPGRSLLGSGKLDLDDGMEWACIDPKSNNMNVPQVPNLHKINLPRL
jgi:hypothetical protein